MQNPCNTSVLQVVSWVVLCNSKITNALAWQEWRSEREKKGLISSGPPPHVCDPHIYPHKAKAIKHYFFMRHIVEWRQFVPPSSTSKNDGMCERRQMEQTSRESKVQDRVLNVSRRHDFGKKRLTFCPGDNSNRYTVLQKLPVLTLRVGPTKSHSSYPSDPWAPRLTRRQLRRCTQQGVATE